MNKKKYTKEEKLNLLIEFKRIYGRYPKSREVYKECLLGYFFFNLKKGNTKISAIQKKRLEEDGILLQKLTKEEKIHKKVNIVCEFVRQNNRTPKQNEYFKNENVKNCLNYIINNKNNLTERDIENLKNSGVSLIKVTREEKTKNKINLLLEFYEQSGRLPKQYEEFKGEKIGVFLSNVKRSLVKIPSEYKKMLDEIIK